nr:MAG TPA: hypothetical protein [Caudoviricetes sp.]
MKCNIIYSSESLQPYLLTKKKELLINLSRFFFVLMYFL